MVGQTTTVEVGLLHHEGNGGPASSQTVHGRLAHGTVVVILLKARERLLKRKKEKNYSITNVNFETKTNKF